MQKTRERVEKKRFSVEEYYQMFEAGVFGENARVELIDGEVFEMAAMGSRHAACIDRLNRLLSKLASQNTIVRVQCPIQLDDDSEPEPDVALLKFREDFYASGHPKPSDVLLAVEVSDTSLEYDTKVKLPAYARAGVPEVWVVDLNSDTIQIHSNPQTGEYRNTLRVRRGETFKAGSLSDTELAASNILG